MRNLTTIGIIIKEKDHWTTDKGTTAETQTLCKITFENFAIKKKKGDMAFPVDERYINDAETELGVKFPASFKERMKRVNGGVIELEDDSWTVYPVFDKSDVKRIKRTSNHIPLETKNSRKWDNFPVDAVAVGENGLGDKLVLLPERPDASHLGETIYLWLHETGEINEICDNISELEQ